MLKQAKIDIKDTNLANYRSLDHYNVRKEAAESEKAWENVGKSAGLYVWRIEKFEIKEWPQTHYGSFYNGDSYIVLHTYKEADSDKLKHDAFFWLGISSSQDEQGVAAYKTVELDDYLNDAAVQHREVQGYESKQFLKLFNSQIRIWEGGVDSGFNHVKPEEYKPRLLHMKGKKHIRVSEVPLALSSLNNGDVFVLDAGLKLYQWNGASAGVFEKRKAGEVIQTLKDERLGKPTSVVLDAMEDCPEFWNLLGGKGEVAAAVSDEEVKPDSDDDRLIHISDASGSLQVKEIARGKSNISRGLFNSDDVYILDMGTSVYVWVGKNSTKKEKSEAINYAAHYLAVQGRSHVHVTRVLDGHENQSFNAYF